MATSLQQIPFHTHASHLPDADLLPYFLQKPIELYLSAYHTHGPLCRLHLGNQSVLMMSGLDANHFVWRNPQLWDYARSNVAFKEQIAADHLDALSGEAHQKKRKILQPVFSPDVVMRHLPALNTFAQSTFKQWAQEDSVDFMRSWLFLIAAFRFQSFVQEPTPLATIEAAAEWQFQFIHGISLGERRHAYYARPEYITLHKQAMALFTHIAKNRLDPSNPINDCLTTVLEKRRKLENPIDLDGFKDDVYMLTVAGIDNIATLVIELLKDIIHQPGLLQTLRDELDPWDGEDLKTFSQLPTLKAVVLESQRLRPQVMATTASFLYPFEDFEFAGHLIPAGTPILHPMVIGHYLEEHYPDPLTFRYERFLEDEQGEKKFVPRTHGFFGGGAHLCIGKNLGLLQAPLLTAQLIKHYDLQGIPIPDPNGAIDDRSVMYLKKMPIKLTPRA